MRANIGGIYRFRYLDWQTDPRPLVFVFRDYREHILGFNLNYLPLLHYNVKKQKLRRLSDRFIMKFIKNLPNRRTAKHDVLNILREFREMFYGVPNTSLEIDDMYDAIKKWHPWFLKLVRKYKKDRIRKFVEIELI